MSSPEPPPEPQLAPPFAPVAVVFDLDGLLVDSEDGWGQAEERVVRDLGYAWDPAVRALLLGRGPREAALLLAAHLSARPGGGSVDPDEVERRLLAAALDVFAAGIPPCPGALELVGALDGLVPLGVATNSRRIIAEALLASSGLAESFGALVTADDVASPKPHPQPYVLVCRRLGVDPRRTVVIEDSPVGVAAARAAGCWTIAVPSLPGVDHREAHAVASDLCALAPHLLDTIAVAR